MNSKVKFTIARVAITLLFLIVTMLQLLSFPGQITHMRDKNSWGLVFEISLLILVVSWMLSAQIALINIWKIISHMKRETFFTTPCIALINNLLKCFAGAITIAVSLFALLAPQADDPGFFVLLTAVTLFISTLYILVRLLRDQLVHKVQ
jgi:hypothetical protein